MKKKIVSAKNLKKDFKVKEKTGNFLKDTFTPKFKSVEAVKNISFDIFEGESVAFLGPNGAGKTTTTKMLTGLIYPTSGKVEVLDFVPFERQNEYLRKIGFVMGSKAGLNWDLTASQSFRLLQQIYRIPLDEYKKTLGELTEMLDVKRHLDTQVRKLSLGERMKMELIGSIIHKPKIVFLDEPTIGLDIIARKTIREFLRKLQKDFNITILLTSHDMDDIEQVCDRVIIVNKGEKIFDDLMSNLVEKYQNTKFITFRFNNKPTRLDSKYEVIEETENSITIKVPSENSSQIISNYSQKYEIDDIDIQAVPLEEIIRDLFTRK